MKGTLPNRARLGVFEFDLRAGELRRDGQTILLQEQPAQVLRMLIAGGGDLVTREEMRKKLWPNDTVVEFDHGINTAIQKLRQALGDSADKPSYIQTVARRGYRLVVPVEWIVVAEDPPAEVVAQLEGGAATAVRVQPDLAALTGRTVSHYRVLDVIGGGGMGVVYRAEDLKLGRAVALKFLPEELGSDPQALERFSREARAASSLDHPNICSIFEFGDHEGRPFMVMPLLEGQTLRDRLAAREGALPLEELLDVGIQVSDGLQAAHERGIIHRDIKPANIFITSRGVCKILDFGLAKMLESGEGDELDLSSPSLASSATSGAMHLTRTGSAMGTAGYMSPEQVRGEKLDARTDVFSFGLVLYEMATGQRAFTGETAANVHRAIVNSSPPPVRELNATLPAKLITTIDKALEKDREKRYQGAAGMLADLEAVRDGKRLSTRLSWEGPVAVVLLLAAVVTAAGVYWRSRNAIKLTDQDTIVLADFTNSTTDPVFDDALNVALRVELEQTPFLDLLAADKARGTLKQMNHGENEKLTPEVAREVCLHTNSKAAVQGTISDVGNHYGIELKAVDCHTGRIFAKAEMEAEHRNQVVKMLGIAGNKLRAKLGEPAASLGKFNHPLDEATSSSLEALQAFSEAERARVTKGNLEAIPLYKRAIELDPSFAVAHSTLGALYVNLGDNNATMENLSRAFELRDRVDRHDRFVIEAGYYHFATGELEKAVQVYSAWLQSYPRDTVALLNLGYLFVSIGQHPKAAALDREAIRLGTEAFAFGNLIYARIYMNRLDEALVVYNDARSRKVEWGGLAVVRYYLAFLQGDKVSMEEQARLAMADTEYESAMLSIQAYVDCYYGRFARARKLWRRAADLAKRRHMPAIAADFVAGQALAEALAGNSSLAHKGANEALALSGGATNRYLPAVVLGLAGDGSQAQAMNQERPADTIVQNYWLPSIQAGIELGRSRPAEAFERLQRATPYDLSYILAALPVYLRGQAYLQAGQAQRAAKEFQKVLDNPGVTLIDVHGPLAHLQLGRAQLMMGDKAAARKSYQDFLTVWKDADPDIPIYKQAKAEYASLQ